MRIPAASPLFLLWCCTAPPRDVEVRQFGTMREVMHDGLAQGRVRLADLDIRAGTIAVGALAGLAGEITVHGPSVYVARPDGDGVRTWSTILPVRDLPEGALEAALLTVAHPLAYGASSAQAVVDEASLVAWLQAHAARAHVDAGRPQPLCIDGRVDELEVHVVRGACPDGGGDSAQQPWRWSAPKGTAVELVGFYAPGQEGVMTHHGTALHLHAIVPGERTVTGHVDRFVLQPGAAIRFGTVAPE